MPAKNSVVRFRVGALSAAAVSVIAFAAIFYVFVTTTTGQRIEEIAFHGSGYGRTKLWRFAQPILDVVSVGFVALVLIIAIIVAIARTRWLMVIQIAIVLGGGNLLTQVIKKWIDRPDLGVAGSAGTYPGMNTLPSGHTTVAATVVVAVLLMAPMWLRPLLAVLGAGYAAVTGVSTLVGGWHRNSDVIAALLVTAFVACIALSLERPGSRAVGGRQPRHWAGDTATATFLVIMSVLAAILAVVALWSIWRTVGSDPVYDVVANRDLLSRQRLLTAYAGGALSVVSVACAVVALVVSLLGYRGERTSSRSRSVAR